MRGTFTTLALLLAAVSAVAAAGSPARPLKAQRRVPSAAHRIHPTTSKTSKTTAHANVRRPSRRTELRTKARPAARLRVERIRYTPLRKMNSAVPATGYEADYKSGYKTERTEPLREPAATDAEANLDSRAGASMQDGPVADAAADPAIGKTLMRLPEDKMNARQLPTAAGQDFSSQDSSAQESSAFDASAQDLRARRDVPAGNEMASLHIGGTRMTSPLRGTLASLERQNSRLDAEGLERIEDEADLTNRIEHRLLVPLPASAALTVNANLSDHHRYCRPWTAQFLADLARAHEAVFHRPIQVNSAVRTVEYQKRLMTTNGNAAQAEGDIVSPHLTGSTIDIGKSGLDRQEMAWMRRQLLSLQDAGKIDVEEEFEQACFHITVYKNYGSGSAPHKSGTGRRKAAQPAPESPASPLPADLAVATPSAQGL